MTHRDARFAPEDISVSGCTTRRWTHARNLGRWRYTTHDCDRPVPRDHPLGDRRARQERRRAGPGRHPARRRLRRRHAAHRQPVHQRDGVLRERPLDAAELPRRDPGADGNPAGGQLLPAALRRPRHHDAGRRPGRLVAMNPGALRPNLADLPGGGLLIVDSDEFTPRNLAKVGYATNPLEDGSLEGWQLVSMPLTSLTLDALAGSGLGKKEAERSKNMFPLGLLSWMYHRPTEGTIRFLERQFRRKPQIAAANIAAFRAGFNYGETTEAFAVSYEVKPAPMAPGRYRHISGNQALAYGIVAAGQRSGLPVFLGAYPITPASDILHELSKHKSFGVRTFQAEDEIAGIGAALGAAFGGALGVTTTSGPGISLKSETIGLAVMTELPLLIIDVQRGGPSTGLPTKTEQSDLLQAMFGRNGEAPVPVIAPKSPGDCFDAALEAARIALTYRTPVILLSDGYLANGAEPWSIPSVDQLPELHVDFATEANGEEGDFLPYLRDPETLARSWAIPGTAGLQHRVGGLEKADRTGNISYDPDNHDFMTRMRQAKVDGIAASLPPTEVDDPAGDAKVAVIGWGSTYGPIGAACRQVRSSGRSIAQIHLRHLSPMPADLGKILAQYDRVVCPEMTLGQLALLLRAKYLVDVQSHTQVRGLPFRAAELASVLQDVIDSTGGIL